MLTKPQKNLQAGEAHGQTHFAALRQLGLHDEELTALRRQGCVQQDNRRAARSGYWRLRFRFQGRFRTVYLGRDEALVAAVRYELGMLQAPRRAQRKLARAVASAKKRMQRVKSQATPVLMELGIRFHGYTLRRTRRPPPAPS